MHRKINTLFKTKYWNNGAKKRELKLQNVKQYGALNHALRDSNVEIFISVVVIGTQ